MRTIIGILILAAAATAQTRINGSRQIVGSWDASSAAWTKPARTGPLAGQPAACADGEVYIASDAPVQRMIRTCKGGAFQPMNVGFGTTPPASCEAGEMWIDTDAPDGQNVLVSKAAGSPCVWVTQGGGSSGGAGVGSTFVTGNPGAQAAGATWYQSPLGTGSAESTYQFFVGACTARDVRINLTATHTGDGAIVYTVRKNGADTALTATVPAGAAAGVYSNTNTTVLFNDGDRMTLRGVNNSTGSISASILRSISWRCN